MSRVLAIGDTHEPYSLAGYLDFCQATYKKYGCGTVVHIGDEIDAHAISDHDSDPDLDSPGTELRQAIKGLKPWYKAFPNVKVCIGNHTSRMHKRAYKAGIPAACVRTVHEILEAPKGWKWAQNWLIDGVLYCHGKGCSGHMGALNRAIRNRRSTVIGHIHSCGGVLYQSNGRDTIFGLNVGCGVDDKKAAFAYGMDCVNKSTIGCGVILDGRQAIWEPMP